ncbi:MAG: response regulator [Bryobacteraceae bacterium]|nr:response regulator [Bryobacteraceae bacterium]
MVIRRLVERLGYRIEVVKSGREAVEAVRGGGYAMVLMDCQMPDMDGFEATEAIRRLMGAVSAVPVVAVTANAMPGFREQCLAAGMDDYLPKPILLDDLARVLGRWVAAGQER